MKNRFHRLNITSFIRGITRRTSPLRVLTTILLPNASITSIDSVFLNKIKIIKISNKIEQFYLVSHGRAVNA
jgi:hypothetical protein